MKATDFEFIEKGRPLDYKYEGLAFVAIYDRSGYISSKASEMLDVRKDEGLRFAKRGDAFFMFRSEAGSKGGYKLFKKNAGNACFGVGRLITRGLEKGDYILLDPVHVEGLDLFELVPASEYQNRIAA